MEKFPSFIQTMGILIVCGYFISKTLRIAHTFIGHKVSCSKSDLYALHIPSTKLVSNKILLRVNILMTISNDVHITKVKKSNISIQLVNDINARKCMCNVDANDDGSDACSWPNAPDSNPLLVIIRQFASPLIYWLYVFYGERE